MNKVIVRWVFIFFSVSIALVSAAQEEGDGSPLTANLSVGYESDDNVTTSEIDSSSGISDEAIVTDLGLALNLGSNALGVELGFDFSHTDYDIQDAFDIQSNTFSLILDKELFGLNLMGIGLYTDVKLASVGLLDMTNYILSAGKLVGEKWYISPGVSFAEKDFDTNNDRDADQYGIDISLFYFGDMFSFRILYRHEDEDTAGDETDYRASVYTVSIKGKAPSLDEKLEYQVKYQNNNKEYANVTQSIGNKRSDDKDTISLSTSYSFNNEIEFVGTYTYIDSNSNLSASDFDQNIFNMALHFQY